MPSSSSTRARPLLLFFTHRTSGPCRRMQGIVSWIAVTKKKSLRVVEVDTEARPDLATRLQVGGVPCLVLIAGGKEVGRLEGKVTGDQIDELIRPVLEARPPNVSRSLPT